MRAALYCRVNTSNGQQPTAMQHLELEHYARTLAALARLAHGVSRLSAKGKEEA